MNTGTTGPAGRWGFATPTTGSGGWFTAAQDAEDFLNTGVALLNQRQTDFLEISTALFAERCFHLCGSTTGHDDLFDIVDDDENFVDAGAAFEAKIVAEIASDGITLGIAERFLAGLVQLLNFPAVHVQFSQGLGIGRVTLFAGHA